MRWKQIIEEGIGRYKPMFASLFPKGEIPNDIIAEMNHIEQVLQRMDRVTWGMRWLRFSLVGFEKAPTDPSLKADYEKRMRRVLGDVLPKGFQTTLERAQDEYKLFENMIRRGAFEHWLSLPVKSITDWQFDRQLPSFIEGEFSDAEAAWIEETENNTIGLRSSDEVLIDFGKGWCWFNLHRGSCEEEGKAMGHCGNVPSATYGDTILSLRENIHEERWKPHLTFIVDGNGFIGESKGRGNDKPVEKYHPMIIALLRHPIIQGIKGGGYMPENNFSLDDIDESVVAELKQSKVGFNTLTELLAKGDEEGAHRLVKIFLQDYSYHSIDKKNRWICFDQEPTVEAYARYHIEGYNAAFRHIERLLIGIDEKTGQEIYNDFYNDYFDDIVKEHLFDFVNYHANLSAQFPDGKVQIGMTYMDFDDCRDPEGYNFIAPSDILEYYPDSDFEPYSYIDDIDEAFCSAWKNNRYEECAATIYGHYTGNTSSAGSPTIRDPNQLSFKFD